MSGWRSTRDWIVTIAAVSALALSLWQVAETREQARRAVRPYLILHQDVGGDSGRLGVYIQNKGTGPAIISRMTVSNGVTRLENAERDGASKFYRELFAPIRKEIPGKISYQWTSEGTVLSVGEKYLLVEVPILDGQGQRLPEELLDKIRQTILSIDYTCAYTNIYEVEDFAC